MDLLSKWQQKVFEMDIAAIYSADLVIAVLDGSHIDEGVAFEVGFAFASGKPCIGFCKQMPGALFPLEITRCWGDL